MSYIYIWSNNIPSPGPSEERYLTNGRKYLITKVSNLSSEAFPIGGYFVDDNGNEQFAYIAESSHLDGSSWRWCETSYEFASEEEMKAMNMNKYRVDTDERPLTCEQPDILDKGFNAFVMGVANRLFPCGYTVSDNAPADLAQLTKQMDTGRCVVSSCHSDNTIFGDPEVNWAFRAWHDHCHYRLQASFTMLGECIVAHEMCCDIDNLMGKGCVIGRKYKNYVMEEVIGQYVSMCNNGAYTDVQMDFARDWLEYEGEVF